MTSAEIDARASLTGIYTPAGPLSKHKDIRHWTQSEWKLFLNA